MPPRFTSSIRAAARAIGGLVFPEVCVGCGGPLAPEAPVCPPCERRLPRPDRVAMLSQLSALSSDVDLAHRACALWSFDSGGAVQRLQHALKYRGRERLGFALGERIGRAFASDVGLWRPSMVLPVPLARVRELERGYNQSSGLARGVSEVLGASIREDLLVRRRATVSQAKLAHGQRWTNVEGAFGLSPEAPDLAGVRVLIVDDVLTTGATLIAAAEPLAKAGAEIGVAALAHAG